MKSFADKGIFWFRNAADELALNEIEGCLRISDEPRRRLALTDAFRGAIAFADVLAHRILPGARAVRALYFDKSQASNWVIGWHQDRVIAVQERVLMDGFMNWTRKEGTWHVEPPVNFLARMVFLRVHLDDTDTTNGCMQIALGSHLSGKIDASQAGLIAQNSQIENCIASRGDVLAGHALILHRSGPSHVSTRRRALRIDYSADRLPAPLEWTY